MSEMASAYDPTEVEPRVYAQWRERNCFAAQDSSDKPAYMIAMPPPNVTGVLHMGHALTATLQDVLTRWKRMSGYNALWLPGTDHAGIATQMVVERAMQAEGISRFDLGREKFLERVWDWKAQCHGRITQQHERLGVSCDWERERFTMDDGLSTAVREVFVRLYEDNLCYRSERLVNWDPKMHTVLSDLEVENEDTKGHLWHFAYPVVGSDEKLVVATTRPETMLGDTGVAVHPEDERYKHLIGKTVRLPLADREIPIVADDILVDMEFGTGCVKVTPAHDFNDFETGRRHDLEMIDIFDDDACLNDRVPETYRGLERYAARERIVADLDALGLLVAIEEHEMSIGRSQRSGVVVEPRLSKQWFVDAKTLAKEAIRVVEDKEIQIVPEHWEKTYFHWMYNIRDWCVSRQLWWGHRIPAWYCADCDHVTVRRDDAEVCGGCGGSSLRQDEDVLDTWFSSALWPFSTLGWPEKTPALGTFYPNAVMETGHDILFFWVARMIMMGCHFMEEVPFRHVYLHAMVRDEDGQKMSKTKGNVIDPLTIVDTHGADALRFTLAALTVAGRSIKLSMDRVNGYRNFANKVWNASRFAMMNLDGFTGQKPDEADLSAADRWILTRLAEATEQTTAQLESFDFGTAAGTVYSFFWHELCDWYIELAKVRLDGEGRAATQWVLHRALDGALRLLHPFMPHITEEIWQRLPRSEGDAAVLMLSSFSFDDLSRYPEEARAFDQVIAVIGGIRTIRGENNISPAKPMRVTLATAVATDALESGRDYILRLGRLSELTVTAPCEVPAGSAAVRAGEVDVIVPLEGLVDFDAERARLARAIGKLEADIAKTTKKLSNPRFVERADPAAVEKARQKLTQLEAERDTAQGALDRLG